MSDDLIPVTSDELGSSISGEIIPKDRNELSAETKNELIKNLLETELLLPSILIDLDITIYQLEKALLEDAEFASRYATANKFKSDRMNEFALKLAQQPLDKNMEPWEIRNELKQRQLILQQANNIAEMYDKRAHSLSDGRNKRFTINLGITANG